MINLYIFLPFKNWLLSFDFTSIIGLIAAISTLVMAIVALRTLGLIKRQIRNSQRPNLAISERLFANCYGESVLQDSKEFNLSKSWCKELQFPKDGFIDPNKNYSNNLVASVHNVGVGHAEKIRIGEKFDFKSAIRILEKYDKERFFKINKSDNYIWSIETDNPNDSLEIIPTHYEVYPLGNLLSISIKKTSKTSFHINDNFLAFISCYNYLYNKGVLIPVDELPILELELSFSDVDGVEYSHNYYCRTNRISLNTYIFDFIKK